MPGVIFSGVLAGLLAIAWPVILHLWKRRRSIQIVSSLKIFAATVQKRKVRVESLLLLATDTLTRCVEL
ncbi:MAG: hypothetical protein AAF492_07940 [Verrucomicrobiota bacterium]